MMKNILKKNVTAVMACVLILSQNINFDLCAMTKKLCGERKEYNTNMQKVKEINKPIDNQVTLTQFEQYNGKISLTHWAKLGKCIQRAITKKNGLNIINISEIIRNGYFANYTIDNTGAIIEFEFNQDDIDKLKEIEDFAKKNKNNKLKIGDIEVSKSSLPKEKIQTAIDYLFIAYWINKLTGIKINKNTFEVNLNKGNLISKNTFEANLNKGNLISDDCAEVLEMMSFKQMISYTAIRSTIGDENVKIEQAIIQDNNLNHVQTHFASVISTIINAQSLIKMVRDNPCFHKVCGWNHDCPNGLLLKSVNTALMINNIVPDPDRPGKGNYIDMVSLEYHRSPNGIYATGWPISNPCNGNIGPILDLNIETLQTSEQLEKYIKKVIELIVTHSCYEKEKVIENFNDLIQVDTKNNDKYLIEYLARNKIFLENELADKKNTQEATLINDRLSVISLLYETIENRVDNNQNISNTLIYFIKELFHQMIELEREEKLKQSKNKQEEEKSNDKYNQITEQGYENCSQHNGEKKQKKSLKNSQAVLKRADQIFESCRTIALKENAINNFINNNLRGNGFDAEVKSLNDALKNIGTQYRINLSSRHNNNAIQILDAQGKDVLATGQIYKGKCGQSSHNKINTNGKKLIKNKLSALIYDEFEHNIDSLLDNINQYR